MSQPNPQVADPTRGQPPYHLDHLVWLGGLLGALVALAAQVLVGLVYNGYEAHDLLQAMIPSLYSLGGAVVQAAATILALMLALLSLSRRETDELHIGFFQRIREIALLTSITLGSAILLLVFISIPLEQSKTLPVNWFEIVYYVLVVATAIISGLMIAIVVMLYSAIVAMIQVVRPDPSERQRASQNK
jgi:hypothetical protein